MGEEVNTIPTRSYELEDIENYLQKVLSAHDISISLQPNNSTLRSEIKCRRPIDFSPEDSIGRLLRFTPRILSANVTHTSDLPVTIFKVNPLRIECNITMGAYINGQRVHTIHEFFPAVPPGYKIVKVPSHVIHLPITVQATDHLQLKLSDQDGQLTRSCRDMPTYKVINGYCFRD